MLRPRRAPDVPARARRCASVFVHTLLVVLVPSLAGAQVTSQSPLELVEQWDEVYQAAYDAYEAEVSRLRVLNSEWDRLNTEYNQLRGRDEDRSRTVLAEIQQRNEERSGAISAVRAAEREWYTAGDSFVNALDNYLEILSQTIQGTPLGDTVDDLVAQFDAWDERLREVEQQLGPRLPMEIEPMPEIRARDDDTAGDLRLKASLAEDRARRDAELIADIEQEIADLERRQERDRSRQAFRLRRERFESEIVPIGTDPARVGGADSTDVDLTQTPEQRIERLQGLRDQLVEWREELLEKALELRAEADRRGP